MSLTAQSLPTKSKKGDIRSTVVARWTAGQRVERAIPAPGARFITKFISLAQVVRGPVQPYSAESWPKTPPFPFHYQT